MRKPLKWPGKGEEVAALEVEYPLFGVTQGGKWDKREDTQGDRHSAVASHPSHRPGSLILGGGLAADPNISGLYYDEGTDEPCVLFLHSLHDRPG